MKRITTIAVVTGLLYLTASGQAPAETDEAAEPASNAETVSYYRDIRPILAARCVGCHQPAKASGSLILSTVDAIKRPGDSELPGIVPGQPDESYLLEQVTPEEGAAAMPPEGPPLEAGQIALLERWIEQGAVDDTPPGARRTYDAEHPPQYTRLPVITSIDYSPDGQWLAVAGFHEVLLHRADAEGQSPPAARLIGMSERIASVQFSPDGTKLAVTGGSPARLGEVQIWDVETKALELSLPVTYDTVYGGSWSPDGKLLAFGCADNTVRVIDVATGEQVLFQGAHSDWVLSTAFSTDGSHLVSVSRDMTAKLIEVATERFVDNVTSITPGALRGGINTVVAHPLRDEVLFGGSDGLPKIYQMHRTVKRVIGDDANLLWELPPLPGRIFAVDFSADGQLIAAGSSLNGQGALHLYGMESAPEIPDPIREILVKPTHTRSDEERQKLQQHFQDGVKEIAQLSFDDGGIYAVAIRHDGAEVAAAGGSGKVRILDGASGSLLREFAPVAVAADQSADLAQHDASEPPEQPTSSDRTNKAPNVDPASIVGLTIEPASLELSGPVAYSQVIVTASLSTGDRIDVTRQARLASESPIISVTPTGLVRSVADGTTRLTAQLGEQAVDASVTVSDVDAPLEIDFVRDVAPVLARTGCNAGTCHGAQDGKNGFKLSLRGYDPLFDVRSLSDDLASRRIDLAAPHQSLMLLKPTAQVPHEGGQAVDPESDYYKILAAWIAGGAELDVDSPRVAKIDVSPVNPVVQSIGSEQQVRVVATFADGTTRDVTREAFVESGNTEVAEPVEGQPGLLKSVRRGEAPVLVRYEGAYAATTITVMGDRSGFVWNDPPANNRIDELVHAKLKRTKTSVAPVADDYTFLRRVYLDLTGLPPTPDQIEQFTADPRDSRWKRDALIDSLVGSPEYVEHWSNKWADLLQVNSKFLRREGAEAFRQWIRHQVEQNRPYDEFVEEILTAAGSTKENPPAAYYKVLREPEATMENTMHLFLGTRFNCNKCHDHPFERWTQDQYYETAAFFARVGLKRDPASGEEKIPGTSVRPATPLYEVVYDKQEGEVTHLRTGNAAPAEFPFDCEHPCEQEAPRREQLASWITSADNPYFAASYANRMWAYLTGRGLIEPIDDIRAGNPPTNPELLKWLTREFVECGFDVQHLMRTICRSRTYQLALTTDRFNVDDELNYSHARARRLPAESLYDAIHRVAGADAAIPGVPPGTRAAALPDVGIELPDGFLNNLGRPPRESACECERSNELQMGPIMALINGATVSQALTDADNAIADLAARVDDDRELIERLFVRVLARPATEEELVSAEQVIAEIDEQHDQLVGELEEYQRQIAPKQQEQVQQRANALADAEARLAARLEAIKPEQKRLAEEREANIAAAKTALAEEKKSLLAGLPAWEALYHEQQIEWTPIVPLEVSTTLSGVELKVVEESVVVAEGDGTGNCKYRIVAQVDMTDVTGIRLEALTSDDLPNKGPGRSPDGNFVVSEFRVGPLPGKDEDYVPCKLEDAQADFSQRNYSVVDAIDDVTGEDDNGWAVGSQTGKSHVAVFELPSGCSVGADGKIRVDLVQNYSSGKHQLGRFRISVTRAPRPLKVGPPPGVEELLALAPTDRTLEVQQQIADYYLSTEESYGEKLEAVAEAEKPVPPDAEVEKTHREIARLKEPLPSDPKLVRLQRAVELSTKQLKQKRLTAAQDVAWALINTPEFLYNH